MKHVKKRLTYETGSLWIENKNGIVWRRFYRAVWVFRRKLFVRVSWMDIFCAYSRKWHPCAERFFDFLIFSRCTRETLICRTDLCPGIDFRLKVIRPEWKRSFLCKCYDRISIKTGVRRLHWVVSHIKHQQSKCSTILSNRSLRTELSIEQIFLQ